ncbi:glycosyltransferase family 4 protein [Pleurocapsa sp. PCC 7319]|uniref:glycosyltransferase family 4 protein n=1 Tax=Pleurocapsa sp. PCC 7319 TaxID=118161 RepID=UPI0003448FCB|nr:glycosyltransferase family 4 protein [Pleurocapsa sp. PCC 7319]
MKVIFLSDWITNPYKELLSKHLSQRGVSVREYLWSTLFVTKVLRGGKFDVLHLHTLHPFLLGQNPLTKSLKLLFFISQLIFLRILGVRTVWTVHEWSDKLSGGKNNVSNKVASIAVSYFSGVIVHCKATKQEISKILKIKPEKVFVIPHGNYIHFYENKINTSAAKKTLNLPDNNLVFVLFGNVYRYKGVLEAIEAFKMLDCSQSSLIIAGKVGESGLESEIKKAIDNHTNINLIAERIPDEDVQIYLNAADCILLPYTVYTTSGVAILGMSFGKVCIAPRIGFFQDVIDDRGGFLYDLPHQTGLTKAMKQALDSREKLKEMGVHNLACMERCNWNYVAKLTLAAYGHSTQDRKLKVVTQKLKV